MRKRSMIWVSLLLATTMVAAGCGSSEGDDTTTTAAGETSTTAGGSDTTTTAGETTTSAAPAEPITVGLIEPLTGAAAYYGERILQGVTLAADWLNDNEGGILGRPIELVVEDSATDNAQTVSLFRKIASENDVSVVIGPPHSANYLAGAPLAPELGVIWASAGSGAPFPADQGLPNEFNYRNTVPFTDMVAQHIANVIPALGADRVGSIYSDDNPGVAAPQAIGAEKLAELGIAQEEPQIAPTGTTDFGPQITQLLSQNPPVVLVNLVTEDASLFMKQARERGLEAVFVAGHNGLLDLRVIELSAGAGEGLIVPSHFDPDRDDPETDKFLEAWEAEYGALDDFLVTYGWDIVFILKYAMEQAGTADDAAVIAETWGGIQDLCLSAGCYSYEGPGDRVGATVFPIELTSDGFKGWTP